MKKWYNVEFYKPEESDKMKTFLRENGVTFETSDCSTANKKICHFEILLDNETCVNDKLETEYELVENYLENFMEV